MLTKSLPADVKAAVGEGDQGIFDAVVAVFGNVDSVGDRIVKGAFSDTLKEWGTSGDPIPVLWSHLRDNPSYHIGVVTEAKETDQGLQVRGQLDLDNPAAAQVWRLLKGRRVTQFSFAYDILDGGPVQSDGESVFELRRLKLYEVGPTLIGANQATDLLGTKSAIRELAQVAEQLKAGRVLSAKNESLLRDAHAAIGGVLAALDDSGKATADEPAKDEEPSGAKSEEPMRPSPASALSAVQAAALDLELLTA